MPRRQGSQGPQGSRLSQDYHMLKTTSVGDTRARLFGTGADEGRRFGTEIGDFCDLGCLKQFGLKKSYKQVRIVRIV